MMLNKRSLIAVLIVVACTKYVAYVALTQIRLPEDHSGDLYIIGIGGSYISPVSPAFVAYSREHNRLQWAAAAALDAGQYGKAEADAQKCLSMGLGSGYAQEILAASLDAQDKTQEALHAYAAITDQGGQGTPRNQLPYAMLLLKTGHWKQAVAAYDKQLPFLADGNLIRANIHFSPNDPQPRGLATAIHIALGLTYGWSSSWGGHSQNDKSLAEFHQALTLAPNSAMAHLYYARELKHLGRRAEAQTAFNKVAESDNPDVKAAAEQALK